MRSERIGLRFSKKDEDIISWFLMLKENNIEKSFAVKALLKAFFLSESINGGSVRIRQDILIEPTSISIHEFALNNDIMKIKSQGIKLASFTKDIIRSFICINEEDEPPQYSDLQKIHTRYKLKYLNTIVCDGSKEVNVTNDNLNEYMISQISNSNEFKNEKAKDSSSDTSYLYNETDQETELRKKITKNNNSDNIKKQNGNNETQRKQKKKNPLLDQI